MRRTHAQYQMEASPLMKEILYKVRNHTDYKSIKSQVVEGGEEKSWDFLTHALHMKENEIQRVILIDEPQGWRMTNDYAVTRRYDGGENNLIQLKWIKFTVKSSRRQTKGRQR